MDPIDKSAMEGLESLRRAVANELEKKRSLGHYAVFWRDGRVVIEGDDAPDTPDNLTSDCVSDVSPKQE